MLNFIKLVPTIIDLIKAVEQALPASSGKDKLAAVIAAIEGMVADTEVNLPALVAFVNAIVRGLNALGIFKKIG